MALIVTVTLNPSIDRTLVVDAMSVGGIHRPRVALELAGGKGMNVARAASTLGAETVAVGIVAGLYGRHFLELAKEDAFSCDYIHLPDGATRFCTSVVDATNWTITEFYEPGHPFPASAWTRLLELVADRAAGAGAVTISGGVPPGAPNDLVATLVTVATQASPHGMVIVDSHGAPLLSAVAARPNLIKVNAAEAAEATRMPVTTRSEARSACRALVERGARSAVVTLGAGGAAARGDDGGEVVCLLTEAGGPWSVGSGDAFLGVLAVRLAAGSAMPEALADATAAGAANSMTMGAGRFDAEEMRRLRSAVVVEH